MTALFDFMEYAAVIMAGVILGLLGLCAIIVLSYVAGYLVVLIYQNIKKGGRKNG